MFAEIKDKHTYGKQSLNNILLRFVFLVPLGDILLHLHHTKPEHQSWCWFPHLLQTSFNQTNCHETATCNRNPFNSSMDHNGINDRSCSFSNLHDTVVPRNTGKILIIDFDSRSYIYWFWRLMSASECLWSSLNLHCSAMTWDNMHAEPGTEAGVCLGFFWSDPLPFLLRYTISSKELLRYSFFTLIKNETNLSATKFTNVVALLLKTAAIDKYINFRCYTKM